MKLLQVNRLDFTTHSIRETMTKLTSIIQEWDFMGGHHFYHKASCVSQLFCPRSHRLCYLLIIHIYSVKIDPRHLNGLDPYDFWPEIQWNAPLPPPSSPSPPSTTTTHVQQWGISPPTTTVALNCNNNMGLEPLIGRWGQEELEMYVSASQAPGTFPFVVFDYTSVYSIWINRLCIQPPTTTTVAPNCNNTITTQWGDVAEDPALPVDTSPLWQQAVNL